MPGETFCILMIVGTIIMILWYDNGVKRKLAELDETINKLEYDNEAMESLILDVSRQYQDNTIAFDLEEIRHVYRKPSKSGRGVR